MQAITVRDSDAGVGGLSLTEMPNPHAAENDVIVREHAAGFTRGELDWPGTWADRAGHDQTPSVPGHELSGVVVELGFGTTGLTVGQRVFGQTVLIHVAAGGVGSIALQLGREVGARIIGTGRAADRETALGLGADAFLDLHADQLEDAGEVDVVLDVIGGDILDRSTALVRAGGALVTIAQPPTVQPEDGRAISSSSKPTVSALRTSLIESGTEGLSQSSVPRRALPEAFAAFAPTGAPRARRSQVTGG